MMAVTLSLIDSLHDAFTLIIKHNKTNHEIFFVFSWAVNFEQIIKNKKFFIISLIFYLDIITFGIIFYRFS